MKPNKLISKEELAVLVQELSQGNVEAYSAIYRLYYNRLLRYALQICEQSELAEDVLQDFFTYLAENSHKLRKVNNFEVYLFQSIKRNLFARRSRDKQNRQAKERYWQRIGPLADDFAAAPDQTIIAGEELIRRQYLIRGELAKLPERQREILYLRYYEELNYEDICQILGLSNQVARNYASRAIKHLKKALLNMALFWGWVLWFY